MSATDASTIEAWVLEVRRLASALNPPSSAHGDVDRVSLDHLPEFATPGSSRKEAVTKHPPRWTASCRLAVVHASTLAGAMSGLLAKLREDLDARIAKHRSEIARLTSGLDGAPVIPIRSVPRGGEAS